MIAEKFEALTVLGIANSRMKDFFDLWILSRYCVFEGDVLRQAVQNTFTARNTKLNKRTVSRPYPCICARCTEEYTVAGISS
ncbi:MAG: nucleotidyl transferase AbiEii/AbiGii toxin family protein [Granulosicoccus sp.]